MQLEECRRGAAKRERVFRSAHEGGRKKIGFFSVISRSGTVSCTSVWASLQICARASTESASLPLHILKETSLYRNVRLVHIFLATLVVVDALATKNQIKLILDWVRVKSLKVSSKDNISMVVLSSSVERISLLWPWRALVKAQECNQPDVSSSIKSKWRLPCLKYLGCYVCYIDDCF